MKDVRVEYVVVEWVDDEEFPGFRLDPAPYLSELPRLAGELPAGARDFVLLPAHYRFGDPECVKNLRAAEIRFVDGPRPSLVMRLSANPWMHTRSLTIEYRGVHAFAVEVDEEDPEEEYPQGLDRLLLDEVLPTKRGCSHEIRFTGGLVTVSCEDLEARWEDRQLIDAEPA